MPRTIIAFGSDDPLPLVFGSIEEAGSYMEAVDVRTGGYESLWTVDGHRVTFAAEGRDVRLGISGAPDAAGLRRRLADAGERCAAQRAWDDPVAFANEYFQWRWDERWPRRPRWLSRRIHGDGPALI